MARACAGVGVDPAEVDLLDLYSCFPVAVTATADGLGIPGRAGPHRHRRDVVPPAAPSTTTCSWPWPAPPGCWPRGGANRAGHLRQRPVHQAGLTVLSTSPPAEPFSVIDVTAEVDELEPACRSTIGRRGPGRSSPPPCSTPAGRRAGLAVIDLASGHRTMARCLDAEVMARFEADEPVGLAVEVADGTFT